MNFLSVLDAGVDGLAEILRIGKAVKAKPEDFANTHAGKSLGLFFEKPSLRTWVSSDVGAAQLGMHTISIPDAQVGLGTRETPEDVGRVLDRYLDVLAMRVYSHSALESLARGMKSPVINLLSDWEHPCQAVADLMTIAENRELRGTKVAFVGDGNNVAHSLMLGVTMTGGSITVVTPEGYEPDVSMVTEAERFGKVELSIDPLSGVKGADVVYTDVWTSMGQEAETRRRLADFAGFTVDENLMSKASDKAIFLHCLPAHRGEEVSHGVIESSASKVFDQAENRLHSFKAVVLHLLR